MPAESFEVDVAIIGGGLAANLLMRQLRLQSPNVSCALFERSTTTAFKVGESTVEVAGTFLSRKLGLTNYLHENHLPKNGLRYFFDTPTKDLPIPEMSEIGTEYLPKILSFQLDRRRFEADLQQMNARDGGRVFLGAEINHVDLAEEGDQGKHELVVRHENRELRVRARWVVDCSGRQRVISKQKKLRVLEDSHHVTAAWGRFDDVVDIDTIGDDDFRARVRYTPRRLSTNHFCYDGYWIWFIPLRGGTTSVGVVAEESKAPGALSREKGFVDFLREHRGPAQLLEGASLVDFAVHHRISYGTRQFYSPHRWALIGDAAAFADPFYSPGSDFISLGSDFVCDLIARDIAEDTTFRKRVSAYDRYMLNRFEQTMLIYREQYKTFGSYDIMKVKLPYELNAYYNFVLRPFLLNDHLDLERIEQSNEQHASIVAELASMMEAFSKCADGLLAGNQYHRSNSGSHRVTFEAVIPFVDEMGVRVKPERVAEHRENIRSATGHQVSRLKKLAQRAAAKIEQHP